MIARARIILIMTVGFTLGMAAAPAPAAYGNSLVCLR